MIGADQMACPTCDHTMTPIGTMGHIYPYNDVSLFWCPRCGTLKANVVRESDNVPKLVARVIEFAGKLTDEHQDLIDEFERIGIRESITTLPTC